MIIAVHGFLGLPSDWLAFDGAFQSPKQNKPHQIQKWNLYNDIPDDPPTSSMYPMRSWARNFCTRVEHSWKNFSEASSEKPILLGYSMGGRLALHALLENPTLWSAAIIVGAHPGLSTEDLRLQRKLNDAKWAERFRSEEWSSLLSAWGEQAIFSKVEKPGDAIELKRHEGDYDRVKLARAMQIWSLAVQQNLRPELASLRVPTLWMCGERDRRFSDIYHDLRVELIDSSFHDFKEIPHAGHRVPWDNPAGFIEAAQNFLSRI